MALRPGLGAAGPLPLARTPMLGMVNHILNTVNDASTYGTYLRLSSILPSWQCCRGGRTPYTAVSSRVLLQVRHVLFTPRCPEIASAVISARTDAQVLMKRDGAVGVGIV